MPEKTKNETSILEKARVLADQMNSSSVNDLGALRLKVVGIVDPQSTHMRGRGSMQLGILDDAGAICRVDHVHGGRIDGDVVRYRRFNGFEWIWESVPICRLDNFCAP